MTIAMPSLELLRTLTDEHVVRALADEPRLTRAQLAVRTGLSKPTVAESVRRLEAVGLVADTGERTTARGGVGTYYAFTEQVGCALALHIAPDGVVAEVVDPYGQVRARAVLPIDRSAARAVVTRTLKTVVRQALRDANSQARVAVVSAADPVARSTGRLVHLPDAPLLVGDLSPADALRSLVVGPVVVDNDVNWAARAERAASKDPRMDNFAYLYLGEGLGCGIVSDGEVIRGNGGIAGEVAHITTTGRDGQAIAFTQVFAQLGLRHRGSTAVDVGALLTAIENRQVRATLARAVVGVLAAIVALSDPGTIVVGGPWGTAIFPAIESEFATHPRAAPLRLPTVIDEPSLTGARGRALEELRSALVEAAARGATQT